MSAEEPQRPVLRVVRGEPTPDELAALVAVVAAASAVPERPAFSAAGGGWCSRASTLRDPLPTCGWRRSFSPH